MRAYNLCKTAAVINRQSLQEKARAPEEFGLGTWDRLGKFYCTVNTQRLVILCATNTGGFFNDLTNRYRGKVNTPHPPCNDLSEISYSVTYFGPIKEIFTSK